MFCFSWQLWYLLSENMSIFEDLPNRRIWRIPGGCWGPILLRTGSHTGIVYDMLYYGYSLCSQFVIVCMCGCVILMLLLSLFYGFYCILFSPLVGGVNKWHHAIIIIPQIMFNNVFYLNKQYKLGCTGLDECNGKLMEGSRLNLVVKFRFLTKNDEDVLLFTHQISSMKHTNNILKSTILCISLIRIWPGSDWSFKLNG